MNTVTIYCRRCRAEIPGVGPGDVVSCLGCHTITRATLTHARPPSMTITVVENIFGYKVRIGSGPQFEEILGALKEVIPKKQRDYEGSTWFVHKRGQKRLERWLDAARGLGAEVITRGPGEERAA